MSTDVNVGLDPIHAAKLRDVYRFTLAYVHPGVVRHEFMESVVRTMANPRYQVSMVQVESGTNIQRARNDCVRWFLSNTTDDHLFFVDTDMSWKTDVPAALIDRNVPIVSALYLGRGSDGKAFPVGIKWDQDGNATAYLGLNDLVGLTEVAGVGMGCCMIQRRVLEILGTPEGQSHPDQWPFAQGQTVKPDGGFVSMSEDITFCIRARAAGGFRSYVDSEVGAGHVKAFVMEPTLQTGGTVNV